MKPNTKSATWNDLLHPGDATDFFQRREFLPFDPEDTGNYNATNALWLIELSRLAYKAEPLKDVMMPIPWSHQYFCAESTDTQAMLFKFDDFVVLAFRGTEQKIKDFKTDIDFKKVCIDQEKNINVHEGFYKAFSSIWPQILPELEILKVPVFYTGHSLGGALATLAAYKRPTDAIYTFGSPRVGDSNFAYAIDSEHFRVVDDTDIIPDMPPFEFGYRHTGSSVFLVGKEPTFWDRLTSFFNHPPKMLADHAPINYVDRI
jgi:pimeloyl-ACP methyl ester carboxylesterase